MSTHPMCKDCIAKPVCGAKYGQPCCIEVHRLKMKFGALIANSESNLADTVEAAKNNSAMFQLLFDIRKRLIRGESTSLDENSKLISRIDDSIAQLKQ